jgi:general secretion pathway protein C
VELLFRRYFWVVNLAFLAAAAFLVAKTANVFTERALMAPPDMTAGLGDHHAALSPPSRLSAEIFARVTGIKLPEPVPEVALKEAAAAAAAAAKDDNSSDPVHTGLHAKLWATTVANQAQWSWSVIEDTQAHTKDEYMVGDRILNAPILAILDDCAVVVKALRADEAAKACVIVMNAGHREYIDDKEGNGPVTPVAVATPVVEPSVNPVQSTGDHKYSIPKSEVDKTLANLNDVAMQARIVPAFKDGVATGFKLFSIRPDSIYAKIGIQNGDVIRRLNGFDINSPDKALEAYSKLKEANHIEIDVERNGSVVTQSYDITP